MSLFVDGDLFRSVMRRVASSVTVISSIHEEQHHGMTATAMCSVSADPPTVLIVVNREARSHRTIAQSGSFVVNILSERQHGTAERFAGKLDDQFDGVPIRNGTAGGAIIEDTVAHLECRVVTAMQVGTHSIFVGRVVGAQVSRNDPLLYHDGRYTAVARIYPR